MLKKKKTHSAIRVSFCRQESDILKAQITMCCSTCLIYIKDRFSFKRKPPFFYVFKISTLLLFHSMKTKIQGTEKNFHPLLSLIQFTANKTNLSTNITQGEKCIFFWKPNVKNTCYRQICSASYCLTYAGSTLCKALSSMNI